jgi:hypothetical protein
MKKEKLLKLLASIGILASSTSCEKQDDLLPSFQEGNLLVQNQTNLKQSTFTPFTPITQINLPTHIQQEIIAIGKLSHDIFNEPKTAEIFSKDPNKYLVSIVLDGVTLDTNSVEVKVALALGDVDVRNAINQNDIELFVKVLEDKGYLDYSNITIDKDLNDFLENKLANDPDFKKFIESLGSNTENLSRHVIYPVFVWVYVGVIQEVAVGFNYGAGINAAAWINVEYWLNIHQDINTYSSYDTDFNYQTFVDSAYDYDIHTNFTLTAKLSFGISDVETNIITKNPVLKIWGMETNSKDTYILNEIIDQHVENAAKMIESTSVYKSSPEKIEPTKLRNLLRKPITEKFIDLDLL